MASSDPADQSSLISAFLQRGITLKSRFSEHGEPSRQARAPGVSLALALIQDDQPRYIHCHKDKWLGSPPRLCPEDAP
jgi:hypothetical protein